MLTILRDPAGITGRVRAPWDLAASIQANIERHLDAGGDAEVWLNGDRLDDPGADPRLDALPTALDECRVICRPAGFDPLTWAIIGGIALAALSFALVPRPPEIGAIGKTSPNNSLTGQTNIARAYQGIPDLYGFSRAWPDLLQQSEEEYVDNVKQITEWLCISRGRGDVTAVQYAETPILDIDGADFTVFSPAATPNAYPELNSTTIVDVREPFACDDVNGQEIGDVDALASFEVPIVSPGYVDGTSTTFSLDFLEGSAIAAVAARAPTGTIRLSFEYEYSADVGGGSIATFRKVFDETVTVLGTSFPSGGVRRINFQAPAASVPPGPLDRVGGITLYIVARFYDDGSTTSAIGPFTLPQQGNEIRWNVAFLRGLKGTVSVRAEWWQINSSGGEVAGTRETQDFAYSADSFDQQFRTTTVVPAAGLGRYRITFLRLTPDLGNGADTAKLEGLFAIRRFPTKVLPGVTVVKVRTRATPQATGLKERKFNCRWQRHVRTLTSTTLSASRNFARSILHLWCVAGEDATEFDTVTMAAINSALGETSPLLRFDGGFDDADQSLGERLQIMANHARCVIWRDGSVWTMTRDQSRPTPELQLDYRNLARSGDSAISYAAHLPASQDGVELEFVEEVNQARKDYIRFNISTGIPVLGASANPKKLRLIGCRTAAQAEDRARLEVLKLLHQRVSVRDTALADAGAVGIGSTVRWVDPNDFGGDEMQAGEVLAIDGLQITTSEPLDFKGQPNGRMLFTGEDGLYLGAPLLVTPAGFGALLPSVPAGLYVRDGITRQLGSRYVFGVGLSSDELQAAGLYTVTDIKPGADRTVELSLAEWDARIYGADSPTLTSTRGRGGARGAVTTRRVAGIVGRLGVRAQLTTVASFVPANVWRVGVRGAVSTSRPTDPNFSSVVLLLHADGANNSTTFTDSSSAARSVTAFDNARLTTSQQRFGTASGTFDGTGDYLTLADNDAWHFGSGDFTIECWIRPASFPGAGQNRGILCQSLASSNRGWIIYIPPTLKSIQCSFWQNDSTVAASFGSNDNTLALNVWHHIAVVRDGSTFLLFINGVLEASASSTVALANSTAVLDIGTLYSGSGVTNSFFNGQIDEVRITKGVARYLGNFTPPASPFPDA